MDNAHAPGPFQYRCTRQEVEGYAPERYATEADMVAQAVFDMIKDLFGLQGIRTLSQVDPEFFGHVKASVQEAFRAGMQYQQAQDGWARLDEGMRRNTHMLAQIVQGFTKGRSERDTAIAVVAANAGIAPEDINLLLDGSRGLE